MKKAAAEQDRDIDFSRAKRGAVVKPERGKTKISIGLTNAVLKYFRDQLDKAGGGNCQTLINDALLEHIHRSSVAGRRASSVARGARRGGRARVR